MGKKKDTTNILNEIREYIGEGGMVAFEHGFRRPTFKIGDYKYKCNMVSDKVMFGVKYYANGEKRSSNYPLSFLNHTVLNTIFKAIKKYEEYCKNEA